VAFEVPELDFTFRLVSLSKKLNRSGIAMSETILGPNHILQTFFKIVTSFVNFRLNRLSGDQENFLIQKVYNSDVRGTKNA
jgi:hypothetical protein